MKKISGYRSLMILLLVAAMLCVNIGVAMAQELVVYSGRGERLIKPVLDEFTKRTGIKITLHSGGTVELFNKLLAEVDRTPGDVFLTVDAGTLRRARIAGLLEPIKSEMRGARQ